MENLIKKRNELRAQSAEIYYLLGHFGDRLPNDVQDEMYQLAERKEDSIKRTEKKIIKFLEI
tara:strand:- start:1720 stop:1905 length:186 start_codon:yes stop_codon:yes gene_type:complete